MNAKLADDSDQIDRIVPYHELCDEPERIVAEIAQDAAGRVPAMDFPELSALDDEYETGGPLESANRVFKRTGGLDLAGAERAADRLEPFTAEQRDAVLDICGETAARLGLD